MTDNIHKGLDLLNNKSLPAAQKREQFAAFLMGLTDMKRIALFTLGQYRRTASPADLDAFANAFQSYATAVYQSYFARYAGQTLKVTGSTERAPGDFIVATALIDPNDKSGQPPLEVDFRVRTEGAKPWWWISPSPASGWRWRNATSSPPFWARTTAISRC